MIKNGAAPFFILIICILGVFCGSIVFSADLNQGLLDGAERKINEHIERALLAKGADVDAKDSVGVTALMYATDWGHKEIVELLKKAGAKR